MISRSVLCLFACLACGNLDAAAPPNDNFAGATVISGDLPATVTGTNIDATVEPEEPDDWENGGASVWYRWTAPAGGSFAVSTVGSEVEDTILYVFTGETLATLEMVAESDDWGYELQSRARFVAEAGTTYYFAIHGYDGEQGALTVSLVSAPLPPNDHFANAALLPPTLPASANFSTTDASVEPDEPDHGSEWSVWYYWTAPSSGPVAITAESTDDSGYPFSYVAMGSSLETLVEMYPESYWYGRGESRQVFHATAGETYRIAVHSPEGLGGPGEISLTPVVRPANDDFANATPMEGTLPVNATGSPMDATIEEDEPDPDEIGWSSVWYRWTAPANGTFAASTWGSSYDTYLYAFSGETFESLELMASSNDYGGRQSRATFTAIEGMVYHFAVHGGGRSGSTVHFSIEGSAPPQNDDFENATVLSGLLPLEFDFSLTDATVEETEPEYDYGDNASVWFQWTAPVSGAFAIAEIEGDYYGPMFRIYTGLAGEEPELLATSYYSFTEDRYRTVFQAEAGVTYFISVYGNDHTSRTGSLALTPVTRPANDAFADAIIIPGAAPLSTPGDITDSSREAGEPQHADDDTGSIWFRWTAPAAGSFLASAQNEIGWSFPVAIYTGSSVDSLTSAANPPVSLDEPIFDVVAGTTYHIAVASWEEVGGMVSLNIVPIVRPANDAFADSQEITGTLPVSASGITRHATLEVAEPMANQNMGSVWYDWTPPQTGIYTLTADSSEISPRVAIFTGESMETLLNLGTVSEALGGPDYWNFKAAAGETYRIQVRGQGGATGAFTLELAAGEPLEDGGLLGIPGNGLGRLDLGGETDDWTFVGQKDSKVHVKVTGSYHAWPYLAELTASLVDASGHVLATASGPGGNTPVEFTGPDFATAGTYRVVVQSNAPGSGAIGNYKIELLDATTRVTPIHLNDQLGHGGALGSPYRKDRWTFEGRAGQKIRFDELNADAWEVSYTLTGPGGWTGFQSIGSDSSFLTLPADGTYTLSASTTIGYGQPYSFRMQMVKVVDLVATCRLKGVIVPDGAFTDSSSVTVTMFTGSTHVPGVTVTGDLTLQMNGDLSAGNWHSHGLFQSLQGVPDGAARIAGVPVFIDTEFEIPFQAEVGESRFQLQLSVGGRRVKMYFSDAHAPSVAAQYLPLVPQDRGLHLLGIRSATGNDVTCGFKDANTVLKVRASSFASYLERETRLPDTVENTESAIVPGSGDGKVTFLGGTRARMETFSYMDWTIFNGSDAQLKDATWSLMGIWGEYLPNLVVTEQVAPITVTPAPGGNRVVLGIESAQEEWVEIQSSGTLGIWTPLMRVKTRVGSNQATLGPFADGTKFFRVVPVDGNP